MWFILVVALFLSPVRPGELNEEKPLLQEISLPKKLADGQAVRLSCALLQGYSVSFQWTFNGEKLTEDNRKRIIYHEDLSDLMIKSLSVDDLGDYQCTARNGQAEDSQRVSLLFDVKPKFVKEPQDVTLALSNEISLDCDAKGYPPPTSRWVKLSDDKKTVLKEFKSKRIVFELTRESAGAYRCRSENAVGSIEKTVSVGFYGK